MNRKTRVRFAPSPTGPLHMGGVRTALYNYLYAKQNGGDFILRIEDTDSHRFVPGAEQYIIEALSWCGIVPDEGVDASGKVVETPSARHPHAPYRQSQRKPIYRQYAEQLIANGYAYYAFDTADELAARRAEAEAAKQTFIYNQVTRKTLRNSLTLPAEETARLLETTTDWTIRFKMPENTVVVMDDLIRGHIEVNTDTLDDKVLWKRADELPTYHLANIVDDHLMEITEVIRGEEWLPSLPLHYMLYKAFGWEDTMPRFAHLSLLLKALPDRACVLASGIWGGRADHLYANMLTLLAYQRERKGTVIMADEKELMVFLEAGDRAAFSVSRVPRAVSLLPFTEAATVSISGVRWPLAEAVLTQRNPYAVSNQMAGREMEARCSGGTAGLYLTYQE